MKLPFTHLVLLPLILLSLAGKAQSSDWTPVFLTPSGNHIVKGVEAYFQAGTCDNQGVVYIKFVNTNNYPVNLEWHNAVFTTGLTWIHQETDRKSLTIPANTSLEGSCQGEPMLVVNLSQFLNDSSQFKRLSTVELLINAAN